jgi:hypothetical protein
MLSKLACVEGCWFISFFATSAIDLYAMLHCYRLQSSNHTYGSKNAPWAQHTSLTYKMKFAIHMNYYAVEFSHYIESMAL